MYAHTRHLLTRFSHARAHAVLNACARHSFLSHHPADIPEKLEGVRMELEDGAYVIPIPSNYLSIVFLPFSNNIIVLSLNLLYRKNQIKFCFSKFPYHQCGHQLFYINLG